MERIEAIQLEIIKTQEVVTLEHNNGLVCNNPGKRYNHQIHSENAQLNLVTDLIINLARTTSLNNTKIKRELENINEQLNSKNQLLIKLVDDLTYIKKMIDIIYENSGTKRTNSSLINVTEFQEIMHKLDEMKTIILS